MMDGLGNSGRLGPAVILPGGAGGGGIPGSAVGSGSGGLQQWLGQLQPGDQFAARVVSVEGDRLLLAAPGQSGTVWVPAAATTAVTAGQLLQLTVAQVPEAGGTGTLVLRITNPAVAGAENPALIVRTQASEEFGATQATGRPGPPASQAAVGGARPDGAAWVVWIPIQVADRPWWVRLTGRRGKRSAAEPQETLRLDLQWESPHLGQVDCHLTAWAGHPGRLAGQFRATPAVRAELQAAIPELGQALAAAGFGETQFRCLEARRRPGLAGAAEPGPVDPGNQLDIKG